MTFVSFAVNRLERIVWRKDGVGYWVGPLRAWRPFDQAQDKLGGR